MRHDIRVSSGALMDALGLVHGGVTWKARIGPVSIGACLQDRVSRPRISSRRSLRDGRMAPWPCVRAGQLTLSRTVSLLQVGLGWGTGKPVAARHSRSLATKGLGY